MPLLGLGQTQTGSYNTALGAGSLASNTTASSNTAVGYQASYSNTTGTSNVCVGYQAGYANVYGQGNTFVGYGSGQNSAVSSGLAGNTFIGTVAGNSVTTGTYNTFVGFGSQYGGTGAGYYVSSGSYNTIIGGYNGNNGSLDIRTASNYVVLSDGAGNVRGYFDNSGIFNVGQTVNGITNSNGFTLNVSSGSMSQNHVSGTSSGSYYSIFGYNGSIIGSITQSGTTAVLYNTTSDYRLKSNVVPVTTGLSVINQLNPVNFTWISDNETDTGFLAHEFQSVIPRAVTGAKDAVDSDNKPIYQQMDNSGAVPYLVAAIKELNTLVTTQATEITALKAKVGI